MEIVLKPIVTEKMTDLSEKFNRFAFVVSKEANKIEIKKAIEEMYEVSVKDVNTMNYAGKTKSRNTKAGLIQGKTASYKKAIVTLQDGDSIDFFSNI